MPTTLSWPLHVAIALVYLVLIRRPQFIDKASECSEFIEAKVRRSRDLYRNIASRFNQQRLITETWFFIFQLLLHSCMEYLHLIISGISPVLCYNHGYAYIIRRSLFAE